MLFHSKSDSLPAPGETLEERSDGFDLPVRRKIPVVPWTYLSTWGLVERNLPGAGKAFPRIDRLPMIGPPES